MKKVELISFVLALLATIGNLYLINGSNLVLVFSISALGMIYVFGGMNGFQNSFRTNPSFENQKTAFVYKLSGYSMAIIALGILFYQLIWPGHRSMIIAGSTSCIISLGALLYMLKDLRKVDRKILLPRLVTWTLLGGYFLFTPQINWVKMKYNDHPSVIESFENMQNNPKNDSLRNIFQASRKDIE